MDQNDGGTGDEPDEPAYSIDDLGLPMPVLPEDAALDLLTGGELRLIGQLSVSSNNAMLAVVSAGDLEAACIYKPVAGERPLRDFPDGTLARREVAAFAVSRASGWGIVPPTVLRDGPFGEGMVQLWIRHDGETDPVALVIGSDPRLRRIAVFDAAVNNTDRKAGHLVPVPGGHIYGVDHGVTFSPVPKLRTVLWEWRGQPFLESGDGRPERAPCRSGQCTRRRPADAARRHRGGGHAASPRPAPGGGRLPPARPPLARDALAARLRLPCPGRPGPFTASGRRRVPSLPIRERRGPTRRARRAGCRRTPP